MNLRPAHPAMQALLIARDADEMGEPARAAQLRAMVDEEWAAFDARGWRVHRPTGIAMPSTPEQWEALAKACGLDLPKPDFVWLAEPTAINWQGFHRSVEPRTVRTSWVSDLVYDPADLT